MRHAERRVMYWQIRPQKVFEWKSCKKWERWNNPSNILNCNACSNLNLTSNRKKNKTQHFANEWWGKKNVSNAQNRIWQGFFWTLKKCINPKPLKIWEARASINNAYFAACLFCVFDSQCKTNDWHSWPYIATYPCWWNSKRFKHTSTFSNRERVKI